MTGVTSWNSELPSGRNPFWVKDESLSGLGLHAGEVLGVDTRREPVNGDLVLVEVETDEVSDRLVRRYMDEPDGVRLAAASPDFPDLRPAPEQMIVLGVVCSRVRFGPSGGETLQVIEEPL